MTPQKRQTLAEVPAQPTDGRYIEVSVDIEKSEDPQLYALFTKVRGEKREALLRALLLLGLIAEQSDSVDKDENACAPVVENFLDIEDLPDWVKELLAAKPSAKGPTT